jgi:Mrp family chromosome partitioning ATPase
VSDKANECSRECSQCPSKGHCDIIKLPQNEQSNIKKVIAVVSGKGGVGKSLVTSLLASQMQERGKKTAILDADITGPSIPKAFGINEQVQSTDDGLIPAKSKTGISIMSINLILERETDPVIWRGPVISGVIQQFWKDVLWGDVDYMFIDMPPGTGDVPLTVYQSLPIDGVVIVTTPQDLVTMIVTKAYNMAKTMNIPVMGIVENMSYIYCPDCGKKIEMFGKSKVNEIADALGIKVLARLPMDSKTAELVDKGDVELADKTLLKPVLSGIMEFIKE